MSPLAFHSPYNSSRRSLSTKLDYTDDDKQSLISRSSGAPRTDQGLDTLRLVAGNRVRHARCAPEFLEEMAVKGIPESVRKAAAQKFSVIAGQEARTYFKNYVERNRKKEFNNLRKDHDPITNHEVPVPVVFAVTVWDGSNKCVDFHMTWRGISKPTQSSEIDDRIDLLDAQFKELARVLDREFKHISSLAGYRSVSQTRKANDREGRSNSMSSSTHRKNRPAPSIMISSEEEQTGKLREDIDPLLPPPPNSATDSVMSLPLLNMVRGVPLSHHVPLRVTNPDNRLSLISEDDALTLPHAGPSNAKVEIKVSIPEHPVQPKHNNRGDSTKWSVDSTSSEKSTLSSASESTRSRSSSRYSSPNSSPEFHSRLREISDDSHLSDEPPKYVIVLLGTSLDKDENSWHGLDRQTSIRSVPSERRSPWIGPLARPHSMPDRRYTPTHTPNDSDSETDSAHWKNIPVIPLKPLMESMGLVPSSAAHYSPAIIPQYMASVPSLSRAGSSGYHTPASTSNVTLPIPNTSPYIYSSPRLDCSPYPAGWQHAPLPPSRPASMVYSPASTQSSPYVNESPRHYPY